MKHKLIIFLMLLALLSSVGMYAQAPKNLTLAECYTLVRENAPQLQQLSLNRQEVELEQEKLAATNLPNVSAYGKASYQSDAIEIPIAMPGQEPFALDLFQYNVGVELDQKIYDGGIVNIQKDLKAIEGEIKSLETEIGLYKLKELVNRYFFGIVSLQKSYEIIELKAKTLEEQKKTIESGIRNGVLLPSDLSRIVAEQATAFQQLTETEMGITKLKISLQILIGAENLDFSLTVPEAILVNDTLNRFELELFQANRTYIESASKLQNKRYIPKFYAYGQTGYSYPGLNMFENQSDYYYIVGVKMAWQIFDWNQSKKEKQLLNIKKTEIDISQTDFERNIEISTQNQFFEIEKLEELIKRDGQIVTSKEEVTKASASALKNGTITSVEYLGDLNSELRARFNMEIHTIKLTEAQANLALVFGVHTEL